MCLVTEVSVQYIGSTATAAADSKVQFKLLLLFISGDEVLHEHPILHPRVTG